MLTAAMDYPGPVQLSVFLVVLAIVFPNTNTKPTEQSHKLKLERFYMVAAKFSTIEDMI